MKIALVCDDLIQWGGAERVVMAVSEVWKDAPIYTSVASEKWQKKCKDRNIDLRTSFLQKFPFASKLNRFYAPFFLHTLAFQSFDFSEYDLVLSLSSRFAHHIIVKPSTKHVCYMHSPGRMFWESKDYFEKEFEGGLKFLKTLALDFLLVPLTKLRIVDYIFAKKIDRVVCNSKTTMKRVRKYFGIKADLIYPFPDNNLNSSNVSLYEHKSQSESDYFLVITRLISWKKVDLAIKACVKAGRKLKIIGDGPDKSRLKIIAEKLGCDVEFLGYRDDAEKFEELRNCLAVINTQYEDFGMVPLEAMSCGKPVIAFGKGGALETIIPGVTGEFFDEQTPESLLSKIENFDRDKYNAQDCINRAEEFSKEKFQQRIKKYIDDVYL